MRIASEVMKRAGLVRRRHYYRLEAELAHVRTLAARAGALEAELAGTRALRTMVGALELELADARALAAKADALEVELANARILAANVDALEEELANARALAAKADAFRAENHLLRKWRASIAENVSAAPELEMNFDAFDAKEANDRITRFGCLIVRGNERTKRCVTQNSHFLTEIDYTKWPPPAGGGLWFFQRTTSFKKIIATIVNNAFDLKAAQKEMPEIVANMHILDIDDSLVFPIHQLVQEFLYDLCETRFRTRIMMSSVGDTATLRTVSPATSSGFVPFHQDISPVDISRALTFWTLVNPDGAGETSPGLRFVVPRNGRRLEKSAHKTDTTGYHEIAELGLSMDDFYWTPTINVGDIVIFDPYAPHASFADGRMTKPRTSVDLRVAPFEARRANSFLTAGHGLVLFDQSGMLGPTRVLSTSPSTFEYGRLDSNPEPFDASLEEALHLAQTTPF